MRRNKDDDLIKVWTVIPNDMEKCTVIAQLRRKPIAGRALTKMVRKCSNKRCLGVSLSVKPGQIAMARMPCLAKPRAMLLVIATMPALDAA